ncbi:MAG: hypothetical protein KGQ59_01485 [Bdellovibrionales bacterium]|nr:hypothetical protein [Bdellovibrionales bacterium]
MRLIAFLGLSMLSVNHLSAFASKTDEAIFLQRPDGTKQCEFKDDAPMRAKMMASLKQELKKAKIRPLEIRHLSSDGKIRIQMCGAPTGAVFLLKVRKSEAEAAKKLGFVEVSAPAEKKPLSK